MRFRPRSADSSVNIPKTHPLKEVALLAGGFLALICVAYLAVGLLASWIAESLPVEAEKWLGQKMASKVTGEPSGPLKERVDRLVALLPQDSPLKDYDFVVYVSDDPQVNAMALPGGTIVVCQGLIDMVESENELDMVLAHELGHFAHRDHLKRLGKGLILNSALWLLFGRNGGADQLMVPILSGLEARYSQAQEEAADLYGMHLLYLRHGHVGGATDFFKRIMKGRGHPHFAYLLASHPHPETRMERLRSEAERRGWPFRPVTPLPPEIARLKGRTGD